MSVSQGISYLQVNNRIKLSESQINQIIDATANLDENSPYRTSLIYLLFNRKSDKVTNFFKKELQNDYISTKSATIQYFMTHDIEFDFVVSYLISEMKGNQYPQYLYKNIIEISIPINDSFTLKLLNSKTLVDIVYDTNSRDQFEDFKNLLSVELNKSLKESAYKKTYLFNKTGHN